VPPEQVPAWAHTVPEQLAEEENTRQAVPAWAAAVDQTDQAHLAPWEPHKHRRIYRLD